MKRKNTVLSGVIITLLIVVSMLPAAEYMPGELIVKLEPGLLDPGTSDEVSISSVLINSPELEEILRVYNTHSVERVFKSIFATPPFTFETKRGQEAQLKDLSQVYILRMNEGLDMEQVAAQAKNLPGVIYAEPNYYAHLCGTTTTPIDPNFTSQWGLDNDPDEDGIKWDVNALKAWNIETGNPEVRLAILDTGLEPDHNDESGDEFYDRVVGEWWVWTRTSTEDLHGHGTHVTGIAAALTNDGGHQVPGKGTAGVAGGWNNQSEDGVSLLIARNHIFDYQGEPVISNVAQAIEWATAQGADVLNGSFGGPIGLEAQREAIENAFAADMTCFFATGNDGGEISYPARRAGSDICCAVGNMTSTGRKSSSSNYGPEISFVAPGSGVYSTDIASSYYGNKSGTSMASPHAAGVAALLYSEADDIGYYLRDVDCKRIMEHTARDINEPPYSEGWDELTGYGCVDAWEALRHLHWPYEMEHGIIPNSNLQVEDLGIRNVIFTGPNPHGTYTCQVYRLSATIQFSPSFVERPWVWGRLMDTNTGFSGANPNNCAFYVGVTNLSSTSATLETYVYDMGPYGWAPFYKNYIQIAYTTLGKIEESAVFSIPNFPYSNNYGQYSDLTIAGRGITNHHRSCYDADNGWLLYFYGSSVDVVDYEGDVGKWSSIAVDQDGNPHIAYYDATNTALKYAKKTGSSWSTQTVDNSGDVGECTDIVIDPDGYPHIGCFSATLGLPVHVWQDASGWHNEPINLAGNFCDMFVAADIDQLGNLHACAYFRTPDGLRHGLVYGYHPAGGAWSIIEVVDSVGDVGKYCDIAVDKEGKPYIAYYDATNDFIKYAVRDQSGWQVDTASNPLSADPPYRGKWLSICIDDDDLPIIAFQTSTGENVKCIKQLTNPNKDWKSYFTYEAGILGNYGTAVDIDNLGRVMISFYDETNGILRHALIERLPQNWDGITHKSPIITGIKEDKPFETPAASFISITPNPIADKTTIRYSLPYAANTHISVYDVTGQKVKTLVAGKMLAGIHEISWEGLDDSGQSVSAGVYFVRMKANDFQTSQKITLLR